MSITVIKAANIATNPPPRTLAVVRRFSFLVANLILSFSRFTTISLYSISF
jgi:hypothetical protein